MSNRDEMLRSLLVGRYLNLTAWGYPKMPLPIFDLLSEVSRGLYGDGNPWSGDNPFSLDRDTTQADVDAAFRELELLRESKSPDFVKWLWLEECLIEAIAFATSWKLNAVEITETLDSFEVSLTEQQRALALLWGLDHIENCERMIADLPRKEDHEITEADEIETARWIDKIYEELDAKSRVRLGAAIEADDLLSQVIQRKP